MHRWRRLRGLLAHNITAGPTDGPGRQLCFSCGGLSVTLIPSSIISPGAPLATDHPGFTHRRTHARVGWQGPPHEPAACGLQRARGRSPPSAGLAVAGTHPRPPHANGPRHPLGRSRNHRPSSPQARISSRAYPQTATTANPGASGPGHQRRRAHYPERPGVDTQPVARPGCPGRRPALADD